MRDDEHSLMDRSQTLSLLAFLSIPCLLSLGILMWGLTYEVIHPRLQRSVDDSRPAGEAEMGTVPIFRRRLGRIQISNTEALP